MSGPLSPRQAQSDPIGWLLRAVRDWGFEKIFKRYYGIYRGIVVDTADPEKRGRCRIQVPAVGHRTTADMNDNVWALPCQDGLASGPMSGQMHGSFHPPNVDDRVWVCFEGGRPEFPVYMGGWLTKNNFEGTELIEDEGRIKGIRTATGHFIQLNDVDEELSITIAKGDGSGAPSGTVISMTKDEEIVIGTANKNQIHLSETQTNLFAPDGSNLQMGDGLCQLMDANGNAFGLVDGKFQVTASGATLAADKITLKGNVDLGPGPVYQPAMLGQQFQLLYATHIHTVTFPGSPNSPQVGAPLVKGNGLSLGVRVS